MLARAVFDILTPADEAAALATAAGTVSKQRAQTAIEKCLAQPPPAAR